MQVVGGDVKISIFRGLQHGALGMLGNKFMPADIFYEELVKSV